MGWDVWPLGDRRRLRDDVRQLFSGVSFVDLLMLYKQRLIGSYSKLPREKYVAAVDKMLVLGAYERITPITLSLRVDERTNYQP